jgi:hypothetical protein
VLASSHADYTVPGIQMNNDSSSQTQKLEAPVSSLVLNGLGIDSKKTNFDRIIETSTSYDGVIVTMYKSRETGLKVLVANVEMPIVCLLVSLLISGAWIFHIGHGNP